jgi:putative membrane protein
MTPHLNLTKALLVLGLSAGVTMLPAQNTPTQSPSPDRQSTRSGSDTTDREARSSQSTSGDKTHSGAHGSTDASRSRTAGGSELMVGPTDLKFMNETAQSGLMEVQAATIAEEKAQSEDVKQFAKKLREDHTKANEELKALAAQKNVDLPTEMGPKHQAQIAKLQNLSEANFDKQWTKMQVDHHKKDVKEFQRHADRSMDSHVKAFAEKTLPTLQQHLQTAQNLQQTATRSRSADRGSSTTTSPDSDRNSKDATQKPQGQNNPTTQR